MEFVQIKILIQVLLFSSIFVMVYLIVKNFNLKNQYDKDAYKLAQDSIKSNKTYKKESNVFEKIQNIILRSNLNNYITWLNVRTLLIISFLLGFLVFIISYKYLNNVFTSIILFGVFGFIPIYLLELIGNYKNSKVEKDFVYFLNILLNFAQIKDDVYFAFEKSIGYVREPLNGFCKIFVEEVRHGLPIEDALENFKSKLDNNKFKLFIKNAQLCVRHGGSFVRLVSNNLEIMKQLQIEKSRRKNETALGRILIYIMIVINIVLAFYMFNLYPGTFERIRTDFYGQVIVLINTINLFIVFYLSLRLQKLDY